MEEGGGQCPARARGGREAISQQEGREEREKVTINAPYAIQHEHRLLVLALDLLGVLPRSFVALFAGLRSGYSVEEGGEAV